MINIGKQITELMEAKEEFLGEKLVDENGEEVEWAGTSGGGLVGKYSAMLESADDTWVEVCRKEIFSVEGTVDPFHILCYGVSADFLVKANMYVTMGMTFEYGVAKRYNFSIMLFHMKSTNETVDLEESHYQFDFYVMGTAGIRAGVEMEIAVGLFSLDLDSIGICAETGAYAQLWGYFYCHLGWSESGGKESNCAGAMLVEIGVYLEISFKAQLFSSEKLTYQPTIYENEWPLLTIGSPENVYDFAYEEDDPKLKMEVKSARSINLPSSLFDMNYMDMKSGELYGSGSEDMGRYPAKNYDDATESNFIVELSNPKFSYSPSENIITVEPGLSTSESCKVTITWKGGPLAFTARPVRRTLTIDWSDPANTYYISFNAKGGAGSVSVISAIAGAPISQPADPVKTGYTFGGWYKDYACDEKLDIFPETMEAYPGKGITLYARWIPNNDTKYKVEHYLQELNGTYTLYETEFMTGTTDLQTSAAAKDGGAYEHFTAKPIAQQTIAPDGSTVVKVYYERRVYTVSFTYGELANKDLSALTYSARYGSTVYPPMLALCGYDFDKFEGVTTNENGGIVVTGSHEYHAKWIARNDTPYRVEHYVQSTDGEVYLLSIIESRTGVTASRIIPEGLKREDSGLSYQYATSGGVEQTEFALAADGKMVIKLYYRRNTYDLSFMDGSEVYQNSPVRYGAVLQAPAAPTKNGYSFGGWYESEDCSGSEFSFEGSPVMPAHALTLYARWIPRGDIDYKVEHYKQNADGSYPSTPADTEYLKGVTGAIVTAASKSYENFSRDNSAYGTVASGTVAADGSLVLRLYYARDTFTLTFKDGEDVLSETSVRHGAPISAPALAEKPGFALSWEPAVPANMPAENVAYTAVWTARDDVKYTVEYYWQNADDDEYYIEPVEYGGTTGNSVTAPEKNREHFRENTSHENRLVEGIVAGDGSLVLRRYYDRETFTVTFDANGGTMDSASKTFRYGQRFQVSAPVLEDYAFDGWYNGDTKFEADIVTEAMNLTARWKAGAVNYTVEHYIMDTGGKYPAEANFIDTTQNGTVDETVTLSALKNSDYEAENGLEYAFAKVGGEEASTATVKKGMIVRLYYERKAYPLTWELNGGSEGSGSYTTGDVYYGASITLPTPVKTGFTFGGWFTDIELKKAFAAMPAEPLTLYAKWTINQYTIAFNTDGGSAVETVRQDYGSPVSSPEAPAKEGYTFAGWDREIPAVMPAENIVITALWTPISYSISYNLAGGSASNPSAYTIESGITLNQPTREGYTFTGWTGTGLSKETMNVTIPAGSTGDREYTATWALKTYNISYTLNGGSLAVENPTSYTVESGEIMLNNPTRDGYAFAGWTGTGLGAATPNVTIPAGSTGERSYTATWTPIQYTITYNGMEGATHSNPTKYTVLNELTLSEPARSGYRFIGWTGTGLGVEPTLTANIPAGSIGDRSYTAHWEISDLIIEDAGDLAALRSKVNSGQ